MGFAYYREKRAVAQAEDGKPMSGRKTLLTLLAAALAGCTTTGAGPGAGAPAATSTLPLVWADREGSVVAVSTAATSRA